MNSAIIELFYSFTFYLIGAIDNNGWLVILIDLSIQEVIGQNESIRNIKHLELKISPIVGHLRHIRIYLFNFEYKFETFNLLCPSDDIKVTKRMIDNYNIIPTAM
ncbi:hypothetical protein [Bacteroides acidifaciens]|uniref:hypothetical protein n=1 Tax=Bacteroides acidifaciens TaxID=85831 RepID=UPI0015588E73|nr:hypothetical protein [Bacteroides acidifaciens]